MADKLTPQQAMAVEYRGEKLLVSAAAGSGKTKVLVDRLMRYLLDPSDPANLDEFLIITYTKAAASELRGKIAQKLTEYLSKYPENNHMQRQMQRLYLTNISTVHGFCSETLREYAYKLDIASDFRVADENEVTELRTQVLDELLDEAYRNAQSDADFRAFVDSQGLGRDDRLVPEIILKVYDSAMCHLDPDGWLEQCLRNAAIQDVSDASETVWGAFLMQDLFTYLDLQINSLRYCISCADDSPGMEKVAVNLRDTCNQLEHIRESDTWEDILSRKNIEFGRLTFPRKNVDTELAEQIKAVRKACKKGIEKKLTAFSDSSEQVLSDMMRCEAGARGLIALVRRFREMFGRVKQNRRVLDFSDLEHKMLDLLLGKNRSSSTSAAKEIGNRYREIMVDEYQDSNGVQDAIFNALTGKRNNCFMVGDVKQSIYQFRLADPGIFLEKYHTYRHAEEAGDAEGRKILLSHNFRSGAEVIEAVNSVFSDCMRPETGGLYYTEAEALREGVPHIPLQGPGVELYALEVQEESYPEEAEFTAQRISQMLRNRECIRKDGVLTPVQPEDIVILLRSPNSVGRYYQRALEAKGIPCNTGGGSDLLQTEEIAVMRALLQIIVNPRQDIPLTCVLASPLFGFTADDLAAFRSKQRKSSAFDALNSWNTEKAAAFLDVLGRLRREAPLKSLAQLLQLCFALTNAENVFAAMPAGEARLSNLRSFYQLASDFETGMPRDVGQFLEHLDALEGKGRIMAAANSSGGVTIMSIHKSKGLEFPVVFLCSLARKFNKESLRAQILCDQDLGIGLSVADSLRRIRYPSVAKKAISIKLAASALSEEMRVLYVAMTRAKDRLIMMYSPENLEATLQDAVQRRGPDLGNLLCAEASCPGDWILFSALGRTEGGDLFRVGGHPKETKVSAIPWKIAVVQGQVGEEVLLRERNASGAIPDNAQERLKKALEFLYPYRLATVTPSKQTATGRKGRQKDEEVVADTTQHPKSSVKWRKPSFAGGKLQGKAYGNAIHSAMQYLDFSKCTDLVSIRKEVERMVEAGLLTKEQGELVNCEKLCSFFETEIGKKLREGISCLREFKFSILDDAGNYVDGIGNERVLLQGVVDCALMEEDGITVLDFKTDYVTEQTMPDVLNRYRLQMQTYCDALSRIFERPVKNAYIYLFHLEAFFAV